MALLAFFFQLLHFTALLSLATAVIDENAYSASSIIRRDICIIGGGSTGTYSAIRLTDSKKSVIVVEAKDRLGGHTNTYTDPDTNETVDYGVVYFHNLDSVRNYFARFDIPLETVSTAAASGEVSKYVDFRTGKVVAGYVPTDPSAALAAYGAQLAKYPYVETGFDLPYPVPADLLLPFGDFVKKYNLQAAVNLLFTFAQGLGNLLDQLTLYVFKNFGLGILQDLQIGFLATARQDNSEIYDKALAELGPSSVLLNSHVLATDRSGPSGVKVLVQTPSGPKLILAKKLLLTIPPKLDNLVGFDLSANETSLFAQFRNSAYYTALIQHTSIPPNVSLVNTGADTPYNTPTLPGIYTISQTRVPGLFDVKVGSAYALPDAQVKQLIVDTVQRFKTAGTLNTTTPGFAAYNSHTPFELTVPKEAIAGGFYARLYGLQGQRHTWYTGAAFDTHDSSLLWQFTERILPGLLA